MARPVKSLVGKRYGRLVVCEFSHSQTTSKEGLELRQGIPYWKCKCDCGEEKIIRGTSLKNGYTRSCGCYNKDVHRTHGMEKTKVYAVWAGMKQRCQNPKHRAYHNYGGRGITVCERWQKFENFYADMGDPTGVIDRIDNDGNYEPENCRWTDWSTSNKNQRRYL